MATSSKQMTQTGTRYRVHFAKEERTNFMVVCAVSEQEARLTVQESLRGLGWKVTSVEQA